MIVFFLAPFCIRGARQAVQNMKNDVKDWLPSSYHETSDLLWFRDHFLGEQFVVISWDGCYGDATDDRFRMFMAKLTPSIPPSQEAKLAADRIAAENANRLLAESQTESGESNELESVNIDSASDSDAPPESSGLLNADNHSAEMLLEQPNFPPDALGLYTATSDYRNWGGLDEKWLCGSGNTWYYITPDGDLYRWDGVDAPLASLARWIMRSTGNYSLCGDFVHSFGAVDGPWYYENIRRLRAQLFKTVTHGPAVFQRLTDEDSGVLKGDEEEAKRRLTGTLFGPDGKQTCIVVTLADAAKKNLHLALGRGTVGKPRGVLYEYAKESNISEASFRLGGPAVDNVAIDEEGTITLLRLVGLSILLGLTLSYLCFRSISATMMVFFVGGLSAISSLAFVWWLGSSVDAVMMSMPSLIYVLGLSGAVHFMHYYHRAVEEKGIGGAPETALMHGWKPTVLCNLTTAIGLATLVTSDIIPIRKFGVFSAIAVIAMLVVLFTYLPAALQLWPQKPTHKPKSSGDDEEWLEPYLGGIWDWLGTRIIRHHAFVAIACTLFIAAAGYGVTRINTSVNLLRMFDPSAKIIGDYEWLESNIGRLVPMEVVLRVGKDSLRVRDESSGLNPPADPFATALQLPFYDRLVLANQVQKEVEREFGASGQDKVGSALSAATFAPPIVSAASDRFGLTRMGLSGKLEQYRDAFLRSDYLREDKETGDELWRISIRLAATKGVDYGKFVHELEDVIEPVLEAQRRREEVLRVILAKRESGANYAGAKILIVGDMEADADQPNSMKSKSRQVFARSLEAFLAQAKAKITRAKDAAKVDSQLLSAHDCVIMFGAKPDSSTRNLSAANVLDYSSIEFVPVVGARSKITLASTGDSVAKIGAVYTGVVPIVYKAQRALLDSLIESTFWSFITITPIMMFVARSFRAGTIAMLPNMLPVLVIFGAMGWMNIDVDVGSMMSASIALGVAVDDTIHFLTWFREELDKTNDRKSAILATYRRCATPTIQAAIISGLGLSIFAFSTFTPTQRFGSLMLAILWAGVAAELIYFPALLAGPLGSCFEPSRRSRKSLSDSKIPQNSEMESESSAIHGPHFRRDASHVGASRV